MARQSSRYFTPVIKRLLDAKQKENIVIDQKMKHDLRVQLMARATSAGISPENDASMFEGVSEFVRRWRYQLAFVPAMLILCLVAVQAFNMTAKVPSEVVTQVPGITKDADAARAEQQVSGNVTDSATQDLAVDMAKEPGIKTFAGRTVLPPDYYVRKGQSEGTNGSPDTPSLQFATKNTFEEPASVTVTPAEASAVVMTAQPAPTGSGDQNPEEVALAARAMSESGDLRYLPMQTETDSSEAMGETIESSDSGSGMAQTSLNVVREESDAVVTQNENEREGTMLDVEFVPVQNDALKPELVKSAQQYAEAEEPASDLTDAQESIDDALDSVKSGEIMMIVKKPPAPEIKPSFEINYLYDLPEDQKSDLENNVIAKLTKDKEVSEVIVSKRELGVTQVEVVYMNGVSEIKFYLKNSVSGKWDEVRFVVRYYYDDSLEYVRADILPAPAYSSGSYPFQYADGYYYGN